MIRGLSPIPRGGGKPGGKEGVCIPTLGALRRIESVGVSTKLVRGVPTLGNTATPSCGFPQKSFPPEGPHDFRGHLRRSRKSDIAAEENSSADYATCRHAPRPKGEQRARGCVLCEPRSALTFSPPVAARTPNKRPSCLRTPRISECEVKRVIPSSKECSARIEPPPKSAPSYLGTLRIIEYGDNRSFGYLSKLCAAHRSRTRRRVCRKTRSRPRTFRLLSQGSL